MNLIWEDKTSIYDKLPLSSGVFIRLDCNDVEAKDCFFIVEHHITFGNSPKRDIRIKSSACPELLAVVNSIFKNSWTIFYPPCYNGNATVSQLLVNEKLLRNHDILKLKSEDQIRFKAENVDLTYSFHIYSGDNPPTLFEMQCYLESILKALETKAETVNQNCAKLISELDKLKNIQNNTKVIYPKAIITSACRTPMGGFKLISSNVTAPVFYFFNEFIISFGAAIVCDIRVKLDKWSPFEATVRKTTISKWQIANDSMHLLFVNDRYFENGETLNLKSGDNIRFSEIEKCNLMYEFQLYLNGTFPTKFEAKIFLETKLNKLQEKLTEIIQSRNKLKTKLESFNEKIKIEPPEAQMLEDRTKTNFVSVNDYKNTTKVKRDETYERSKKMKLESEGSKDIANKLLSNSNETLIVESKKVDASEAKIKTEPVRVFENKSKTLMVKCAIADATEMKIKRELVKGIETISETSAVMHQNVVSNLKIKTELLEAFEIESKPVKCENVNANEVKIKREQIEVNETKIETLAATYEEVVSGDLKIKAELLEAFEIESKTVKCEKVNANEVKIKREPLGVIETISKKSEVKSEKVNATEMKIKKELIKGIETISETPAVKYEEVFSSNLKIKTELTEAFEIKSKPVMCENVNANKVKIKREPVEVIEIDCD